jgi:hypothetical protein
MYDGPSANDALGTALSVCGLAPGPLGTACTVAGGVDTLATLPDNPNDPNYSSDKDVAALSLGLTGASLAGMEAAGPLGLVVSGGYAAGKGAQWLGGEMVEGQRRSDEERARAGSTTGELPPPYINNGPTGDPLNDSF